MADAEPSDIYKSSKRWAEMSYPEQMDARDGRDAGGRFLPRFSGKVCDRIGCDAPIEGSRARFCATHRQEHGRRLLGQLQAVIEEHRAKAAS